MTARQRTAPGRRTSSAVLRLAALLLAAAGLFAMHGLSDHGAAGHAVQASMSSMTSMTDAHADGHAGRSGPSKQPSGDMDGMAGLCLAVLAGALLAAAALLGGPRRTLLDRLRLPREAVRQFACWARARGPAPPDLFQLSIQRC
ncbi:DUF6153 family protein [Nocardioides mangrovi]|uniref:DUF6153 family protein n=1 Tax=Nocardioides mangrovi TaxID=2874580 RepID=A0ABS7UHG3_9ACTN|nr:DUF6153 family protein [Nocardioides mangrovi]MBZ5740317.1 DUF6153 family protein [Nocardioides mangrovi]